MKTINIIYIDTNKYNITITNDDYLESPTTWGNYEIVQFCDRNKIDYGNKDDYFTDNGKLLPSVSSKLRAGKMFSISYFSYSSCDGGYYRLDGAITGNDETIDGFIIFDDGYIKNTSYDERKKYAISDLLEYTQWANGEVYSVTIEDSNGGYIDSCAGFIGDYAVQQFIADTLPNALNENVTINGEYPDGTTYDTYFDYNACIKTINNERYK